MIIITDIIGIIQTSQIFLFWFKHIQDFSNVIVHGPLQCSFSLMSPNILLIYSGNQSSETQRNLFKVTVLRMSETGNLTHIF